MHTESSWPFTAKPSGLNPRLFHSFGDLALPERLSILVLVSELGTYGIENSNMELVLEKLWGVLLSVGKAGKKSCPELMTVP